MTARLVSVHPVIVGDEDPASKDRGSGRTSPTSGDYLERLRTAASEKPAAATLIGLGTAWFLLNASGVSLPSFSTARDRSAGRHDATGDSGPTSHAYPETPSRLHTGDSGIAETFGGAVSAVGGSVSQVARTVGDVASSSSSQVLETISTGSGAVRSTGEAALRTMSDAGSSAYDAASRTGSSAYHVSSDVFSTVAKAVEGFFRHQPLAVGVVGLAMGAGMAALLPKSETEDRYLGEASDDIKSKAKSLASSKAEQIQDAAKSVFDGAVATAKEQGLTASGAADFVKEVGSKIGKVGAAANDSVKTELK